MYVLSVFQRLRKRIDNSPGKQLVYILIWCVVLFIAFGVLFKWLEDVSWEESFWQAWQTFTTVGYGNKPAETLEGRIVTMFLSTLGIAFVGMLFSTAFDYKQYLKDQKRLGFMENPIRNGYVIFNFPGTSVTTRLIRELRNVEKGVGLCIVDGNLEQLPDSLQSEKDLHFVKGNILSQDTYEKAHLNENKAVIVFPVDKNNKASDGSTRTMIDLVKRFTNGGTRIMHVLVDEENAWMFEDTSSTQIYGDLEVLALVQECQDQHSAQIIEQLLSNSQGASPHTVYPKKVIGWTWSELEEKVTIAKRNSGTNCNLFALVQNGKLNTCPPSDQIITEDAVISVIAYKDFNWSNFEQQLS
ncbi:potassium channel family protein [Limibacter armeniacum]|uniref:potassium channel protein n=1 Tax=Limibacter armeniacum TaxID=466084 RepID=UPI002FE5A2F5